MLLGSTFIVYYALLGDANLSCLNDISYFKIKILNRWKLFCPGLFLKTYKEKRLTVFFNKKFLPLISATSSNARASPMNNSNSTLLNSNAKNFGLQESRDNHVGNFRVPATRAVQPRFARATSTTGNALQQDHLGTSGIRGGSSFTTGSGEVKRSETKLTPVQSERQFAMNFPQTVVSNDNHFCPPQARIRDSQRTSEQQLKNENSRHKVTRTQGSDKQFKQHREKNCVSTNERGIPPQRHAPYEMPPSQLFDSEYLIYSL